MNSSLFGRLVVVGILLAGCGSPPPRAVSQNLAPPPSPPSSTLPQPTPEAKPEPAPRNGIDASVHVALGVPKDADDSDDYLVDRTQFVLSYNQRWNAPNWVAWHLDASDLGTTKRSGKFHSDTGLPSSFYVVQDSDYAGSGYDRGHLCPSADRTASLDTNRATFVFTNMHPQMHELNAGPWEKLESYERELARRGKSLFIVAGGMFDAEPKRIGKDANPAHRVAVPKASYKIVVVLEPQQGPDSVTSRTETIAVVMPNDRSTRDRDYTEYRTSIREIERATGYDFLSRVPRDVQDAVEFRTP